MTDYRHELDEYQRDAKDRIKNYKDAIDYYYNDARARMLRECHPIVSIVAWAMVWLALALAACVLMRFMLWLVAAIAR